MTGLRDAIVMDTLLGTGQITLDGAGGGKIAGWAQDPYDPNVTAPLMRNLSEDEKYDAQFPGHPLSRLCSVLRQVQSSMHVASEVKDAPPFLFGEKQPLKPWWKKW